MAELRALYDPIEPFDTGRLKVSPLHELYYEQCGNPNGKPVVFLHGGPGAGLVPEYRQFFDPESYRVVLFDQRGSGRSTPHASLEDNTTWHLVSDIEQLREHLRIDAWQLDCWEEYVRLIPEAERGDLLRAYHRRLTSDDEATRLEAAGAWATWEASLLKLIPDQELINHFADPQVALAVARLECHYIVNNCFFETDNYLIDNVGKIRHIPGVIVQGRYDIVCPVSTAWDLHRAWPEAELKIIPDAGHSVTEPGIINALVEATDRFRVG